MSIKNIFTILLFSIVHICVAQDYKIYVAPSESTNGIQLKWLSKTPVENGSFNIYRKDAGAWTKINAIPVTASKVISNNDLKTSSNPFPNDTNYSFYVQLKNDAKLKKAGNADFYLYLAATIDNNMAKHAGIYFLDNTVLNGKSYTYKLTQSGNEKELAVSETIVFKSYSKSPAPQNITVKGGDKKLDFNWTSDDNFIGYNIYKSDAKNNFVLLNDQLILSDRVKNKSGKLFTENNLENGKTYSYKVSAIDYFGNESELSAVVTGTPVDNVAPHPVRNLQASMTKDKTIALQWKTSQSEDVKGYNIFKSNDAKGSYTKLNSSHISIKDTTYNDADKSTGNNSFYYVEAFDGKGNTSRSDTISVFVPDHTPPAMPKNAVSRVESGKVSISWAKNTEDDLAGYRIYRGLKDNDENSMLLLNSKPRKETSFTDTFPKQNGAKFIYKIKAIDKSFNESEPVLVIAQLPDMMPPGTPFLSEAKYSDGKINLRWKTAGDNDIKGYKIWRKNGEEPEFKLVNTTGMETSYEDKTVTKGSNYQYAVQAVDSFDNTSPKSNVVFVSAVSTSTNIDNPDLSARYDKVNKQVILKYNVDTKNDNIEGYVIYRKLENTNPKQLFTPSQAGSYMDKKIAENETYFYTIQTFFVNGEPSAVSEPIKVETK